MPTPDRVKLLHGPYRPPPLKRGGPAFCLNGDADARQTERDLLTARLRGLDRQLDQGAERLLTCPAEAQARVGAKYKEWQAERDRAARDLARLDAAEDQADSYAARVSESLF